MAESLGFPRDQVQKANVESAKDQTAEYLSELSLTTPQFPQREKHHFKYPVNKPYPFNTDKQQWNRSGKRIMPTRRSKSRISDQWSFMS